MCYDDNARPPLPPGPAGVAHPEELVLTAADGNRFAAFAARPEHPRQARILIFPDIRGLHQFYKELAMRFAEQGISAIAMDYFGRTAGLTARDESFDFRPHVQQLQVPSIFADAQAALEHVRADTSGATFIVGFCIGGSLSLYAATQDLDLDGAIAFYAGMSRALDDAGRTVLQIAPETKTPVLGLFGGADQGIPVAQVEELDQTLDGTGVEHSITIYPDAPHSFFDRRAEEFADASQDAWRRVLDFISAHTPADG